MSGIDDSVTLTPQARRSLGLFPLAFFVWSATANAMAGEAANALWVCNVANLTLGLGLLAAHAPLTWISMLWLVVGTPVFVLDTIAGADPSLHSWFTHFGSTIIAIVALRGAPKPRHVWLMGLGYMLALFVLSRLLTPPELNVNVAFAVWGPLGKVFPDFWVYTVFNLASFAGALALAEWLLGRLLRGSE